MANAALGPVDIGFVNVSKTPGSSSGQVATPANYASITSIRARLTAINAGYYTSALLDKLTVNDMVYALRLNDDASTF